MQKLDPKAVWLFFFGYISVFGFLGIIFGSSLLFTLFAALEVIELVFGSGLFNILIIIFFVQLLFILFVSAFAYLWAKWSYANYMYELREDGFRKEHGVLYKKYVTIPYERIQNVDIYRGIISRILKLSDLQIQTAGMSGVVGSYGGQSEGRLPGLSPDIAEKLRDELIKRARGKSQGL